MTNQSYFKIKKMNLFKLNSLSLTAIFILLGLQIGQAQQEWRAAVGGQFYFAELAASEQGTFRSGSEPSVGLNLGVSRGLNDNWSIHSGIGVSYIQTRNSFDNYSDVENTTDLEGEPFEFRYALTNYSEKQQSMLLSIPISVQYESSGSQTRFYTKLGASANFFLGSTSTGSASDLTTSGFYERFNGELTAPRFAGFGQFNDIEFSQQDADISNSYNLFLELGIKEQIVPNHWLYVGVFVEYGLNDLSNNNGSSLVQYNQNQPMDFINNSVINAANQATGNAFFDKMNLTMAGVRLYYDFGL